MYVSVLDQSPVSEGMTGAQALRNTLDLARLADELGYHRYWVAEHHGTPMLAGPSPEVLVGPIASRHRPHPGGQRRRDAPPLQPAEGGRELQRPRRHFSRAHRPRAGPGGGHRPSDHTRPPARPPPGHARRFPRPALGAPRLPRGPPAGESSLRPSRQAPRTARGPRAVAARVLAPERASGPPSSACPTPSPTSSTPPGRTSPRSTASVSSDQRLLAPRRWCACGRSARTPTTRPTGWPRRVG